MPEDESDKGPVAGKRHFATTHWSIVLAAGDVRREDARNALSQLCEVYWPIPFNFPPVGVEQRSLKPFLRVEFMAIHSAHCEY